MIRNDTNQSKCLALEMQEKLDELNSIKQEVEIIIISIGVHTIELVYIDQILCNKS